MRAFALRDQGGELILGPAPLGIFSDPDQMKHLRSYGLQEFGAIWDQNAQEGLLIRSRALEFGGFKSVAEIRSIVPIGRGHFPHDSRHFVPGYYHAIPLGRRHSPRRGFD